MSYLVTVAHSPDADDIFMYHAINLNWVDPKEYHFQGKALDIETLNQEALKGTYDVSAISFGAFGLLSKEYALLRTAISFGYGYGPKLIRKKGKSLKRNFKVALSGELTTNALLFRIYYPDARIVYKNFLDIEKAVLDGEVDAGVLIHESILDFDSSLEVEKEIWDIWQELAGDRLPLPLGGMAIRRSIPLNRAIEIEDILTDAVKVANERKDELCEHLVKHSLVRIEDEMLDRYLQMYASDESVTLSEIQLDALDTLFDLAYKHHIFSQPIKAREHLIPKEYADLRAQ